MADRFPGVAPKALRERYLNHAAPHLDCGPLTTAELGAVAAAHARLGPRWKAMVDPCGAESDPALRRRSENAVKNGKLRRPGEQSPASLPCLPASLPCATDHPPPSMLPMLRPPP